MRPISIGLIALTIAGSLSGCLAKTVVDVATAPVRVASKTVDMATTSQSEADEKRGREWRRREEKLGRIERSYERHSEQCARGDQPACASARAEYAEIQQVARTIPAEEE